MATTIKRINMSFTKEDMRQLEWLMKEFEEGGTQVIKRALSLLYLNTYKDRENESPRCL